MNRLFINTNFKLSTPFLFQPFSRRMIVELKLYSSSADTNEEVCVCVCV